MMRFSSEKGKMAKKVAALGIAFSLGVTAFAGDGSLWDRKANTFDERAVEAATYLYEMKEAKAAGELDADGSLDFLIGKSQFNKEFGDGSSEALDLVFSYMDENVSDKGFSKMKKKDRLALASGAVRDAAGKQRNTDDPFVHELRKSGVVSKAEAKAYNGYLQGR